MRAQREEVRVPWPAAVQAALGMPAGARFFKCAFQVNPFEYLADNGRATKYSDEASYNQALVEALLANDVQVIAVTDHYRVQSAVGLWKAARAAGIAVLPGFEAVTKEGVHFLCLFDPSKNAAALERAIGACGVHAEKGSTIGSLDASELLACGKEWGAVFVAAHVAANGGLLTTLKGASRASVWKSNELLACSLPGPASQAPVALKDILSNRDPAHQRRMPIAIVNAQDVSDPADVAKPGACCWVKMSDVSIEGIRQAFLDPGSRVRLASDPSPDPHAEMVAMAWEGGFLDGVGVRFNENLNAVIGGRGSGKSTIIESIRYALGLEPLGQEATKAHQGLVKGVLRDGTKISLLVRSHRPAPQEYLIERTVPNPPVIRSEDGAVLAISPTDVIPRAEVYGQHEIAELARSPQRLTRLLKRFMPDDADSRRAKQDLGEELARSRAQIVELQRQIEDRTTRLAGLPALQEKLRRYQEAGVEAKLKDQSQLVTEERVLTTTDERLRPLRDFPGDLRTAGAMDRRYLADTKLADLPGQPVLKKLDPVLVRLQKDVDAAAEALEKALVRADRDIAGVRAEWGERKKAVEEAYNALLRSFQQTKVDAGEFLRLRKGIEDLLPLKDEVPQLQSELAALQARRRALLVQWEDLKTAEFRALDQAAKAVSRQLAGRVRVRVSYAGDREPLFAFLREEVGGRLSEAIDALKERDQLSLSDLADAWRAGTQELSRRYDIPVAQGDRLARSPESVVMHLEELDLVSTTEVELNLSGDPAAPIWQSLDDLSTGQKATAVLLLLLLESDAPLAVDQPEDDLDNRFIAESVVQTMRAEKRRRQFLFATHNANIPVLGDAELILGLEANGEASRGHGSVARQHAGSMDVASVRSLTEELLEGGELAFETRRLKYGF